MGTEGRIVRQSIWPARIFGRESKEKGNLKRKEIDVTGEKVVVVEERWQFGGGSKSIDCRSTLFHEMGVEAD